ncbi:MAG: hypothetical protein SGCHY_002284 [Lobulomycetales sp.]
MQADGAAALRQFESLQQHKDGLKLELSSHYLPLVRQLNSGRFQSAGSETLEGIWRAAVDSGKMNDQGPDSIQFSREILLLFERNREISKALALVKALKQPQIEFINLIIRMHFAAKDPAAAVSVFSGMNEEYGLQPDAETFGELVTGFHRNEDCQKSLYFFRQAFNTGHILSEKGYSLGISSWCRTGEHDQASMFVKELVASDKPDSIKASCFRSLIYELNVLEQWDEILQLRSFAGEHASVTCKSLFLRAFLQLGNLDSACNVLTKDTLESLDPSLDSSKESSSALQSMYEDLLKYVAENPTEVLPVEFCRDLMLDMRRNQVDMTPGMLSTLTRVYCQFKSFDDAMQSFVSYLEQSTKLTQNRFVPPDVYDTLLPSLAANFCMEEFMTVWDTICDTATDSQCMVALDAFIAVKDIPRAIKIGARFFANDRPLPVNTLTQLFEACAITGEYKNLISVFRWAKRDRSAMKKIPDLIRNHLQPISQTLAPIIKKHAKLNDKDAAEQSEEGELSIKAILLLYKEFLGLDVPLPYQLYAAMIEYHASQKDMVNVAKTMALVIKQSHLPDQNPPKADCVSAFLVAATDLCGEDAAKSVLKLVQAEGLELDQAGYSRMFILCARHGWICDLCDFVASMTAKGIKMPWKLYGTLLETLEKNGHRGLAGFFKDHMTARYPEIVGEWTEYLESTKRREMRLIREQMADNQVYEN